MGSGYSPYSGGTNDASRHAQASQQWAGANTPHASDARSAKGSSGIHYNAQNPYNAQYVRAGYGNVYSNTYGNPFGATESSGSQQSMDATLNTSLQSPTQHVTNVARAQHLNDKLNANPVYKTSVGHTTPVLSVDQEQSSPQHSRRTKEYRGQSPGYLPQQQAALATTSISQNTFPQEFQHPSSFQVASSSGISTSASNSHLYPATGFSAREFNPVRPMQPAPWEFRAMNKDRPFSDTTQQSGPSMNQPAQTRLGVVSSQENSGFKYECDQDGCSTTFNRQYDLKRHYNGAHAINPTLYWGAVSGCSHNKGFPRRDKLNDHISKMHKQM